jgi:Chaperone of endosialidase
MKTLYPSLLLAIGAFALAGTAFAQVPSTNDTSDANQNTGMGSNALGGPTPVNLTGGANTASGFNALFSNTTGHENTASGSFALFQNSRGNRNNAAGRQAMFSNTTANDNNAMGYAAMYSNTRGTLNNAVGNFSLYFNTTGNNNSAVGYAALYHNTTGSNNNAQGFYALQSNTTGSNNIAIGAYAGYNVAMGSGNIYIGNRGVADENDVIRVGSSASAAYIAGVSNARVTGSAVYVTSSGQLGVLASSERFKTAIAPMGSNTTKLQQLRPVTFRLKSDAKGTRQYGLIAEEVAKVYPELVIRSESGRIDGVRYDELAPMLLNEVQQQLTQTTEKFDAQAAEIRELKQEMAELKARK